MGVWSLVEGGAREGSIGGSIGGAQMDLQWRCCVAQARRKMIGGDLDR
jgi:hypothetical protein